MAQPQRQRTRVGVVGGDIDRNVQKFTRSCCLVTQPLYEAAGGDRQWNQSGANRCSFLCTSAA